jgi:hypothetical protein
MTPAPKVSMEERISRYLLAMEAPRRAPSDPQDSHLVVFNAARALLHGFGLSPEHARGYLEEYLQRSDQPWSPEEISHKLRQVDAQPSKWPRGYLRRTDDWKPSATLRKAMGVPTEEQVRKKVDFELARLQQIAAPWREQVTGPWLANRSTVDPATVSATRFLELLYPAGEKILIFSNEYSQGDALWPVDEVPTDGRVGIWYLPQPVCGEYRANPEGRPKKPGEEPPPSRRTWRCVDSFRYFVLESDKAPMRDWLGWIVQVPLRIEALYTSGSRSIHALIRVDARTKEEWDETKRRMMPFLVASLMCGADRGTWSAVRLTRLPGCLRRGKMVPVLDEKGEPRNDTSGRPMKRYQAYPVPGEQKLLYFRPGADARPICERPAERDVETEWGGRAAEFLEGRGTDTAAGLMQGLGYYFKGSPACASWLKAIQETTD